MSSQPADRRDQVARRPAANRRSTFGRPGAFTLVELLVVIAIIAMLMTIVTPALLAARQAYQAFQCVSNLRQLAHGMVLYSEGNNDCFPGDANDPDPLKWLLITGGPALASQRIGGTLAESVESNRRVYTCPTFVTTGEFGGDKVACHYCMPTILSGMPKGLVQEGFYFNPITSTDETNKVHLHGAPLLIEPLPEKQGDGTVHMGDGVFDSTAEQWTTLPKGGFEQDGKLDCRRHLERTNIAFHDGHAESVSFPDANIQAQNIYILLRSANTNKKVNLGGTGNVYNTWFSRPPDLP